MFRNDNILFDRNITLGLTEKEKLGLDPCTAFASALSAREVCAALEEIKDTFVPLKVIEPEQSMAAFLDHADMAVGPGVREDFEYAVSTGGSMEAHIDAALAFELGRRLTKVAEYVGVKLSGSADVASFRLAHQSDTVATLVAECSSQEFRHELLMVAHKLGLPEQYVREWNTEALYASEVSITSAFGLNRFFSVLATTVVAMVAATLPVSAVCVHETTVYVAMPRPCEPQVTVAVTDTASVKVVQVGEPVDHAVPTMGPDGPQLIVCTESAAASVLEAHRNQASPEAMAMMATKFAIKSAGVAGMRNMWRRVAIAATTRMPKDDAARFVYRMERDVARAASTAPDDTAAFKTVYKQSPGNTAALERVLVQAVTRPHHIRLLLPWASDV